jgi:hypothetical protein
LTLNACVNAAKVGSEPILPKFCGAANGFSVTRQAKILYNNASFEGVPSRCLGSPSQQALISTYWGILAPLGALESIETNTEKAGCGGWKPIELLRVFSFGKTAMPRRAPTSKPAIQAQRRSKPKKSKRL